MKRHSKAGRSANGAAAIRAMETFVPPAQRLFEDQIVPDFLPPLSRLLLRQAMSRAALAALFEAVAPGIPGALLCRTRRIDDAVRDAMGRGLPALVILGAGFDTRPYRMGELANVQIVEMDLPTVQRAKIARLLRRFGQLPPKVQFVPTDFNTEPLDSALKRGGLDPSTPAIFIWEGVSQYLRPDKVDAVLSAIATRPKGTELVFTYVLEEVITEAFRQDRSKAFRKSATRRPEPWYFGIDPLQLRAFLSARGLSLCHDSGAEDYQSDYLRPMGRRLEVSEIERVAVAAV